MIYQLKRHIDPCIVLSHYYTVKLKCGPGLPAAPCITTGLMLNRYTSLAGTMI